jgi:hypothetical protein
MWLGRWPLTMTAWKSVCDSTLRPLLTQFATAWARRALRSSVVFFAVPAASFRPALLLQLPPDAAAPIVMDAQAKRLRPPARPGVALRRYLTVKSAYIPSS